MRRREVHLSQQKHVMFHGISDRPVQKIAHTLILSLDRTVHSNLILVSSRLKVEDKSKRAPIQQSYKVIVHIQTDSNLLDLCRWSNLYFLSSKC